MNSIHAAIICPPDRARDGEPTLPRDHRSSERTHLNPDDRFTSFVNDDAGDRRVSPEVNAETSNLLTIEEHERLRISTGTSTTVRAVQITGLDGGNDESALLKTAEHEATVGAGQNSGSLRQLSWRGRWWEGQRRYRQRRLDRFNKHTAEGTSSAGVDHLADDESRSRRRLRQSRDLTLRDDSGQRKCKRPAGDVHSSQLMFPGKPP